jgi:CO/xanthine dehydrogenase Mo-binding subunit
VTVETDMTDIGTGSHTIIGQTAAEMMGVPLDKVVGSEDRRIPILFLLGVPGQSPRDKGSVRSNPRYARLRLFGITEPGLTKS